MKIFFTITLLLTFGLVFSQENELSESKILIENKKYDSAYLVLEKLDLGNQNPEIVIEKTKILLDYFVSSIMHQLFALKDLEENEELMDFRGAEGEFSMYYFPPDSILNLLIKQFPENFKLRKTLGYFYHEVFLKYGGNWLEPDSIVLNRIILNYDLAYQNGEFDYWSLYGIGYSYLKQNKVEESIPYFKKSIELNENYPSSYYNLAYAYLTINEREKAIEYAKKALELYVYIDHKSDAAKMIGVIYTELNDFQNALKYYRVADSINPNNYNVLHSLLALEVKMETNEYKNKTTQFFMFAPGNPTIYQNLEEIYWNNGKEDELMDFLESQKASFTSCFSPPESRTEL
ncbi:MAG: tetratricopeptide repeat protein [Bacteroidales bacterium]|nr:tetratricopeptide repeat protein [Bacteroidales bacterium]